MRPLRYILSHALFAAFCAVALCFQTLDLLQAPASRYLYAFVFFATLCSYNFHFLLAAVFFTKNPVTLQLLLRNNVVTLLLLVVSATGLLLCIAALPYLRGWVLPAFAATALYSLPLLPWRVSVWLRKAGFAKTVLLALTWTYVTAWLPVAHWATSSGDVVWLLVLRFVFMLQLCLLFDLRDTAVDKMRGLHSLATDLSRQSVELIFFSCGLVYLAAVYYWWLYCAGGQTIGQAVALGSITLLCGYFYWLALRPRGYFFYYFWVDGLMFLSPVLTSMASI